MADDLNKTTPAEAETEANQTTQAQGAQEAKFTQADIDRVLGDRLKRERNKWEKEYETRLEEEKKKASMEESERLRLELTEKSSQLDQLQAKAAMAEAKAELLQAGGDPTRADKALRVYLAELEDLGEEDETPSFEKFLEDWPEFKTKQTSPPAAPSGATRPPGKGQALTPELIDKMSVDEINARWDEVKAVLSQKR